MNRLLCKLATFGLLLSQHVSGSHIRKDLVEVENDAVVMVYATTVLDSSTARIAHLPISPSSPAEGTKGLVYILPEMYNCKPMERSQEYLSTSYIRIALISDEGRCSVESKIKQAQYDGAVGAFVYNSTMGTVNMSSVLNNKLAKNKPKLPIMVVDRDYGETLRLEVASLQEEAQYGDGTRYRAIFASMYSAEDNEKLSGWEVSLITLVVVLALCFCISMTFHVSSSRRRQNSSRTLGDGNMEAGKQIQTLPPCALDRLALRTVSESDVKILSECTTPLDSILNPSVRRKSMRSNNSRHNNSDDESRCCEKQKHEKDDQADNHDYSDTHSKDTDTQCSDCSLTAENTTLDNRSDNNSESSDEDCVLRGCIATCIVCIDDFVVGSQMRILPCGHNYHIECIDPWLTTKSSMCPLCKYDTRHVLTDLERMYSGPRIIIDQNGFEDILGDSFFSDSDSSSFMAESQARLPIYGKITNACSRAFHATVSPVQKLFRKIRHRRTRTLNTSTEIAMSITQEHSQARGLQQQQPFQDADVISGTSFTPDYTVGADGKYKSHNSEQTFKQGDHSRNHMIEVKTTDPLTPTSKQSVEVKDKADSTKLSQKNNKPSVPTNSSIEDVCMISSRISMSDIITSTSEIRKYYNQN